MAKGIREGLLESKGIWQHNTSFDSLFRKLNSVTLYNSERSTLKSIPQVILKANILFSAIRMNPFEIRIYIVVFLYTINLKQGKHS